MLKKIIVLMTALALVWGFSACQGNENTSTGTEDAANATQEMIAQPESEQTDAPSEEETTNGEPEQTQQSELPQLSLVFGYEGQSFIIELEDNQTALEIARDVGATTWNLPIFTFEGFENDDVLQFYDIPDHYDYTSEPETVTSEKAGDVYYSDPNRIVLFYNDAEVPAEYTKIGTIDADDEFLKALEENPILDGWNCKIITISRID